MPEEDDRPFGVLSVVSDINALGAYTCALEMDGRQLRVLDREQVLAYTTEVTWAITCAEYDAAVLAQLRQTGLKMALIRMVVMNLRNDRRPILAAATHPLEFQPIVSHRDQRGMLHAKLGDVSWQWELADARQHVQQVLEVSAGVDMDATYRAELRKVGLEEEMARGYVRMLREHMPSCSDPT